MNVYEFAGQTEKEAEKRYRDLAKNAPSQEIKDVFSMLADSEKRHLKTIKQLERGEDADLSEFKTLGDARKAFEKIVPSKERFDLAGSQVEAYLEAQKSEVESEKFYRDQAELAKKADQRKVLRSLAEEEHQHLYILDKLILMIAKP